MYENAMMIKCIIHFKYNWVQFPTSPKNGDEYKSLFKSM